MTRRLLTGLSAALLLAACSSEPQTQAEMLVGEWEQTEPTVMTQGGQSVTLSDAEITYKADGTSEGSAVMTLAGVPDDMAGFRIVASSTYTLADGVITETITNGTVEALGTNPQAQQIATMIQGGMASTPASSSTIVTLTEDTLVLRQDETGVSTTYSRD